MSEIATPDHLTWPTPAPITQAQTREGGLHVIWDDGLSHDFHPFWLRENCACADCLHQGTREQLLDIRDLPLDIAIEKLSLDGDGGLTLIFSDDHESRYHPGWLWAHGHGEWALAQEKAVPWDVQSLPEPPSFDGPVALQDPAVMAEALTAFERFGIVRLRGLSIEPGTVEDFALTMGPVRETQFERVFNVLSRPDADSNAYTAGALSGHVDLPTWEATPGIQMLHCLKNSATGGESVMIDGFRLATELREREPEIFQTLTTVLWSHSSRKRDSGYRWLAPIIELDPLGEINSVRFTAFSRDPLQAPPDQIEPAYRAIMRLLDMMDDPAYRMVYPFQPGDLVMFDNRRIFHGREAYDPMSGERHLQGIYIDRDSARAKRRVLEQQRLRGEWG